MTNIISLKATFTQADHNTAIIDGTQIYITK